MTRSSPNLVMTLHYINLATTKLGLKSTILIENVRIFRVDDWILKRCQT